MRKILVTGGAGFIGYFLVKELLKDKNNRIFIIDSMYRGRMDQELKKKSSLIKKLLFIGVIC